MDEMAWTLIVLAGGISLLAILYDLLTAYQEVAAKHRTIRIRFAGTIVEIERGESEESFAAKFDDAFAVSPGR